MKIDFNRTIIPQMMNLWKKMKTSQKASIIILSSLLFSFGAFLIFRGSETKYTPLFSSDRLFSNSDITEIKSHLDHLKIPYIVHGDNTILVPTNQVYRARLDLASSGFPKLPSENKGFELFDSGTWIKGEKELQVLELRALKGQLEKDISQFDNIRSASVILDIAPPRPFGGTLYKTKASIILNLTPGARLSASELRAITFHIAGAVRGLTPNMVAISDTTGRLYQPIDPEGNTDLIRNSEMALEEHLKAKVDGMLSTVVGFDNFYSAVQVVMNREKTTEERKVYSGSAEGNHLGNSISNKITEIQNHLEGAQGEVKGKKNESSSGPLNPILNQFQENKQQSMPLDSMKISSGPGKIENISIAILIDQETVLRKFGFPKGEVEQRDLEKFRLEIKNQIDTVLKGYQVPINSAVNFARFDPSRFTLQPTPKEANSHIPAFNWNNTAILTLLATLFLLLVLLVGYQLLFARSHKGRKSYENDDPVSVFTWKEREKMISILKSKLKDNPDAIASSFQDWLHAKNTSKTH